MAVWSLTKAQMVDRIETLYKRISGEPIVSYYQKRIMDDAINAALQDVCLDYSVSRWRFLLSDATATCTAGTGYVDLTANIFKVVAGTVRIEAEDARLSEKDLEWLSGMDPDRSVSGTPCYYALDASADPDQIRLQLYPTPDSAYTIAFTAETLVDQDATSSFPAWMHSALLDKSKENALRDLGLPNDSLIFERSYEKRLQNAKTANRPDGPECVQRVTSTVISNIQQRAGV